jgi:hypothetical protein
MESTSLTMTNIQTQRNKIIKPNLASISEQSLHENPQSNEKNQPIKASHKNQTSRNFQE